MATADLGVARSHASACEDDLRAEREAAAAAAEGHRVEIGSLRERADAMHQELLLAEAEVDAARGHAATCMAEATSISSESEARRVELERGLGPRSAGSGARWIVPASLTSPSPPRPKGSGPSSS